MKRRRILLALLAVALVGWLGALAVERYYREPENYSRIEQGLYVGGSTRLPPAGASAVLNLCEQKDEYQVETHRWEPIADAAPAPDLEWLKRQVDFITTNRDSGKTVYVHCRNGVSRSGLVAAAYLMRRDDLTRDQALAALRERRPQIRPNPAFLGLLRAWEQRTSNDERSAN